MSNIHEITPITEGMTKIEAEQAVKSFLQEVLSANVLRKEDIYRVEDRLSGVRTYSLITMKDGSCWVEGNKGIERLIGAFYLKNQLELDNWEVVETKCFLRSEQKENIILQIKNAKKSPLNNIFTLHSDDFITCSKYVGDQRIPLAGLGPKLAEIQRNKEVIKNKTGFWDFSMNANLREQQDGAIVIIDTEYLSFCSDEVPPVSPQTNSKLGGTRFKFLVSDILS